MSIQYINLGTAPKGVDGDTQRTANLKMNGNIRYLDGQLTAAKQTADSAQAKARSPPFSWRRCSGSLKLPISDPKS